MNVHQTILPITIIVVLNMYVLRTQVMNPSIGHMIIPINYQLTQPQPITLNVPSETNMLATSTYPIWYNGMYPLWCLWILVCIQHTQLEQKDLIFRFLGNIQVMYLGMCTQYLNNLYHQHVHHILLETSFLQWFTSDQQGQTSRLATCYYTSTNHYTC